MKKFKSFSIIQQVAINPAYQVPELEYCLKKVEIKAIVSPEVYGTQNYYNMLTEIVPELSSMPSGVIKCKNIPTLSAVVMDSNRDLP